MYPSECIVRFGESARRRATTGRAFLAAVLILSVAFCHKPVTVSMAASAPTLHFNIFARTGLPLGDLLWDGTRWIITVEGGKRLYTLDAAGRRLHLWAAVPANNGEMRCIVSPTTAGLAARALYCHAAAGQIYRIDASGRPVTQIAMLPSRQASDGSLAEDRTSTFGTDMIAATGGSDAGQGGTVYLVSTRGRVRRLASYAGPGGAENLVVAPRGFGVLAGQALLAIDKHDHQGRLLAMSANSAVTTVAGGLQWGLNPLAMITGGSAKAAEGPAAGLYLADWKSHDILFAPAADFADLQGSLLTGTERHGLLYRVVAAGSAYRITALSTNLTAPDYNFEAAAYIAS